MTKVPHAFLYPLQIKVGWYRTSILTSHVCESVIFMYKCSSTILLLL